MKKFFLFLISFIALFTVTQILSGLLLTNLYTPNLSASWSSTTQLPQTAYFGNTTFIPTLILAVFSVVVAYFMPHLFKRFSKR